MLTSHPDMIQREVRLFDVAFSGYPRETTVAEKFEAMVKLAQLNSRIRDFFVVWMLSRPFDFDGLTLAKAIKTER